MAWRGLVLLLGKDRVGIGPDDRHGTTGPLISASGQADLSGPGPGLLQVTAGTLIGRPHCHDVTASQPRGAEHCAVRAICIDSIVEESMVELFLNLAKLS